MSWQYLSYPLNSDAFGYANGTRFEMQKIRSICCGDTSNNTAFSMPTHFGTHIDFPFHFSDTGKKSSHYMANDFVFTNPSIIELTAFPAEQSLITNHHLDLASVDPITDILFIKTGFCYQRMNDNYWENGLGFHPETATHLKTLLPNLKAIAFDLISLTSFQNREIGREAHKQFLIENDLLIIEDVNLRDVTVNHKINQVIVACLQLENSDGAPCTIFAEFHEH